MAKEKKIGFGKWLGLIAIHFVMVGLLSVLQFAAAIMTAVAASKIKNIDSAAHAKLTKLTVALWIILATMVLFGIIGLFLSSFLAIWIAVVIEYLLIFIELAQGALFVATTVISFETYKTVVNSHAYKSKDKDAIKAAKYIKNLGILSVITVVIVALYLSYIFYDFFKHGGIKGRLKMQVKAGGTALEVAGFATGQPELELAGTGIKLAADKDSITDAIAAATKKPTSAEISTLDQKQRPNWQQGLKNVVQQYATTQKTI